MGTTGRGPWQERYRKIKQTTPPRGTGHYVQLRPSSGLRYPQLELGRWYIVLRKEERGCVVALSDGELYLPRAHYIAREGRRGADRRKPDAVQPQARDEEEELIHEGWGA